MINYKKRYGFTIVEISIALIVASVLLVAVLNLFRTSLSGSQKGMANLANMETATILMAQIEYDLIRTYAAPNIDFSSKDSLEEIEIFVKTDDLAKGNEYKVIYKWNGLTVTREMTNNGSSINSHVYGKGLSLVIKFYPVTMPNPNLKYGFYVVLEVKSAVKKSGAEETFTLKRLIMCKNMINPADLNK